VYGNVTASNGFIGSGTLLTNTCDAAPGVYGNATTIPQITVASNGRISVSNIAVAISNLQVVTSGFGNVTTNQLQLMGGIVTNSRTGISNTNPGHPFVVGNSNLVVGTNGNIGINTVPNSAQVSIVNSNSSQTVLAVSGNSNQTANLQTWSNTNGTVQAYVNATGSLHINGSFSRNTPVVYSNNATVQSTENWIVANNNGNGTNNFVINLPSPSTNVGREIYIRKYASPGSGSLYHVVSSATNILPLEDYGTPTNIIIDSGDAANQTIKYGAAIYRWATLVSNGTNWVIMAGA